MAAPNNPFGNADGSYQMLSQAFQMSAEAEKAAYGNAIQRLLSSGQQDTAPQMDKPFPTGGILGAIAGLGAGVGGILPQVMGANLAAAQANQQQQGYLKMRQQQRDEKIASLEANMAGVDSELAIQQAKLELDKAQSEEDKQRWQKTYDLRVKEAAERKMKEGELARNITPQLGVRYSPIFDQIEAVIQNAKTPEEVEKAISQFENAFQRDFVIGQDPIIDNWYAEQLKRLQAMAPGFEPQPSGGGERQKTIFDEYGIDWTDTIGARTGQIMNRGGNEMERIRDSLQEIYDFEQATSFMDQPINPVESAILPPNIFQASEAIANASQSYQRTRNALIRKLTNPVPSPGK